MRLLDLALLAHLLSACLFARQAAVGALVGEANAILAALNLAQQFDMVLRAKRRLAHAHLVQHRTDGPQVCLGIVLFVAQNLGSHVQAV